MAQQYKDAGVKANDRRETFDEMDRDKTAQGPWTKIPCVLDVDYYKELLTVPMNYCDRENNNQFTGRTIGVGRPRADSDADDGTSKFFFLNFPPLST